uniref:tyrosine-type recombinase/integrase n=1 Tax=Candidatus Enterococcus willemsii TaxID=1857215 RepID=UPI00403F777A
MASIVTRKSNFAVVYWYVDKDNNRKQKWDSLETKKEAKARKSFIEYYQKVHGYVIVPNDIDIFNSQISVLKETNKNSEEDSDEDITLKEFLEVFVNLYGVSKWSVGTFSKRIASIKNYINPYIGDWKLKEITTKKITQYYASLLDIPEVPKANQKPSGRCMQPSGVKKIHDIIRCALNQAIRWEYLDPTKRNPATLATLPEAKKKKRKVWDIKTFEQALQVTDDDLLSLAMHIAFACSLRVGEIGGLTWDNIIIDEESINNNTARLSVDKELARVEIEAMEKLKDKDIIYVFPAQKPHCKTRLVLKVPKTESSVRTVWLPQTVAELLIDLKREQEELKTFLGDIYHDYNLVFALENGNPVESRIFRGRLQTLCEQNNFEMVDFHSLRHLSTKYKLKMTQGDIKSVQGDTGHTEAEMVTDIYSEIVDEDRRMNARKLEDEFYQKLVKNNDSISKLNNENNSDNVDQQLLEALKSMPANLKEKLLQQIVS